MDFAWDHTHYRCSHVDASVQFFVDHFGAKELARRTVGDLLIVRTEVGGQIVNFSPPRPGEVVERDAAALQYGVYHICLRVPDLDAAVTRLKSRGVRFTREPSGAMPGVRVAFLEGPDQISIELLEQK